MKIAITGATGFLGRYIVARLIRQGHQCKCWFRPTSDRTGIDGSIEWMPGQLGDRSAAQELTRDCRAVVHAALDYSGGESRIGAGFDEQVAARNVGQSLELIDVARSSGVERFVFISSCAVYDTILSDRPLDETHPLWPGSHYGAYKAAVEAFVHSYAARDGFNIWALRPTGIYGVAHPVEGSKWYELVRAVVHEQSVQCERGGKEVHAADVAVAVETLLNSQAVAGRAFNCYDCYVSEFEVAEMAKSISGSSAEIRGHRTQPKNQIVTAALRALGVSFGGRALLERTVSELVAHARSAQ
jgi:nucleoside-diphosphate-sugar epimerase